MGAGVRPAGAAARGRCWAGALLALLCVALAPPARAADGLPPPGPNLELIKAIRADDGAAIDAALAAGASLRDDDYDMFFAPAPLAILLGRPAALARLAGAVPDLDFAYEISVMFAEPAAFEVLRRQRPPPPDMAATLLRGFSGRLRPDVRQMFRAGFERMIDGQPDGALDASLRWLIPDTAAAPDAPEFAFAQVLLDLAGGRAAAIAPAILDGALDAGDVFLADWLLARGIGPAGATFWSDMAAAAAYAGNRPGLAALIARGQSMNVYSRSGVTPLLNAIDAADPVLVRAILAAGADPNAASRRDGDEVKLPLAAAARARSLPVAEALLAAGADPNRIDDRKTWALREAVRGGFPDLAAKLLNGGANPNLRDDQGNTLLHGFLALDSAYDLSRRAIAPPHLDALKLIGAADMDFNARNRAGLSVLASALTQGEPDESYWTALTDLGARPDDGAYDALFRYDGARIARWLFTRGRGDPNAQTGGGTLIARASIGDTALMQILLEAGARLGSADETARMAAAAIEQNTPALMALLLQRGLPTGIKDLLGRPILQLAVERGTVEIVRRLLDGGADPNVAGWPGGTILHDLAESDARAPGTRLGTAQQDAITLLVDRGFDVTRRDGSGKTIFEAAERSAATAQRLLDAVARAQGQTRIGLHDAVRANSAAQIQTLLDAGAAIDAPDSLGRSALALALALGRAEAAKLLLRRGAAITFEAPARGLPAIIDYAGDPRFAPLFPPRLLTDQLIAPTADAAGDIARFRDQLAKAPPPNVDWLVTCRDHCRGELRLSGNSPRYIGLIQSDRRDDKTHAWMRVVVFPHEPSRSVIDGGSLGQIPFYFDPIFMASGSARIPACAFSFASQPFCVPGLRFTMGQYSDGSLLLSQGTAQWRLQPGQAMTLDRSDGDIDLKIEQVEAKSLSISLDIDYGAVPDVALAGEFDDADRMAAYATLAKWRRRRLAALQTATVETIVEAKALAAAERHLSALAIQKGYPAVVRQLFIRSAADVAALDQRVADLRRILQTRLTFSRQDLQLLIGQIDGLIQTAPPALRGQLEAIRDALAAADRAAGATDDAIEVAQDGLFQDVDRIVFEYQGLALELAQYMPPEALMANIPLTAAQRAAIQTRVAPSDVFVRDGAFNGRGAVLRQAFGLPAVAP